MNGQVMVSIVCVVYNHEKYLRKTLDGFVGQITNFSFEILIHDDASTDGSADIIREYANKYPDIFVPIYQTENQYSKGVKIADVLLYPRCRGKYIALCEGDDYWTDLNKLQKQFEILEAHPNIDLCATGANIIDATSSKVIGKICPKTEECIIPTEEVILGGGNYLATNSLFTRTEVLTIIPPFRKNISIDYTMQINGALKGGVYYLPEIMSVYRANVPGSWTVRNRVKDKLILLKENTIDMLNVLNDYTGKKYDLVIKEAIRDNIFELFRYKDQERILLSSEYKECRRKLKGSEKIRFYIKGIFPGIAQTIKRMLYIR